MGKGPQVFSFHGSRATVNVADHQVQAVIDHFKVWLPKASRTLKDLLERAAQNQESAMKDELHREREAGEKRLRVNQNIKSDITLSAGFAPSGQRKKDRKIMWFLSPVSGERLQRLTMFDSQGRCTRVLELSSRVGANADILNTTVISLLNQGSISPCVISPNPRDNSLSLVVEEPIADSVPVGRRGWLQRIEGKSLI
jgi:hypothetical protein